ncbi:MAG: TolC family protein, partial [Spirochaetes bacterium]|nr:TolC family protein [Spirochaetota bacterium]
YENMKPAIIEIINAYNTALLSFKQMIGLKKNVQIEFNAAIESKKQTFNSLELINKYIINNLDIKTLNLSIKSLINVRNIAISMLTPSISIMYSMDPTFQKDALNDQWFADIDNDWKQRSGMFAFSISLPIDVWVPFSSTQMQIVSSQFAIKQAQIGLENAKQGIELQIESLVMQLEKSIKSIESLKLNIRLAERAYKMAEEAYNAGSKELLEVKDSESALENAKLNLLQEEYNYTTALLDLEYAINFKKENFTQRRKEFKIKNFAPLRDK